ncbi:hypothetical protein Afer_1656 [Acidimicrobium ferrooxidans DSM 10331]|uniref:Uncharacterized protein n=1 Tax=Acidimicrobium ferrooxidans (strain DSM 10331 / JCM 15462 / NBRC 103882 / ICP) TaxID=525909 RepID=C7M0R4_ACIFD|nr:hypothetical protein Afer_1656 [Acidimicrobium ferrooxidans DSM 10331]
MGASRWQLPGSGVIREGAWGGRRARMQQCSSLRDQSRLVDHHDSDARRQWSLEEIETDGRPNATARPGLTD